MPVVDPDDAAWLSCDVLTLLSVVCCSLFNAVDVVFADVEDVVFPVCLTVEVVPVLFDVNTISPDV